MTKELPGEVVQTRSGLLIPKDHEHVHFAVPLRHTCTYMDGKDKLCGRPAHYEFELSAEMYKGAKPPIIQWACTEHGKDVRAMPGVIYIRTI